METAVEEYRKRRQKRLDEKEKWITTKKGHKVHLNSEGVPDKGNSHVIEKMTGKVDDKTFYRDLYKWEKGKEVTEESLRERREKINKAVLERCPDLKSCKSSRDVSEYLMAKGYFKVDPLKKDKRYGYMTFDPNYKVDLTDLSVNDAKKVAETVESLFEKYPMLKGKFYGIYSSGMGDKIAGESEGVHGKVGINSDLFKNKSELKERTKKDREIGQHPPTDDFIKSNIYHEFGHVIERLFGQEGEFSHKLFDKCVEKFGISKADVAKEVGKYACTNTMEFMAECFSEYNESKNPRRIAKFVGQEIEKELKRLENN